MLHVTFLCFDYTIWFHTVSSIKDQFTPLQLNVSHTDFRLSLHCSWVSLHIFSQPSELKKKSQGLQEKISSALWLPSTASLL
jgi:hypothetical protein